MGLDINQNIAVLEVGKVSPDCNWYLFASIPALMYLDLITPLAIFSSHLISCLYISLSLVCVEPKDGLGLQLTKSYSKLLIQTGPEAIIVRVNSWQKITLKYYICWPYFTASPLR